MSLISADVGKQIQQALNNMRDPVKLVYFTREDNQAGDCEYCATTQQLVEEVAALDPKIHLEIHDFASEPEAAQAYQIDKVPAIAVIREGQETVDYGIRLYGIPAGYEFSAFIEDILMVSRGQHGLTEKTLQQISRLDRPVHIQVYSTPT